MVVFDQTGTITRGEPKETFETDGKTAMIIAVNNMFRGMVAVADTLKDTAQESDQSIESKGFRRYHVNWR